MTVTYTVGDVRDVMTTIADGSVDLIASSPPFLALRSYLPAGHESKHAEIGSERNPAEFIDMLLGLTAEWGRVLAPHGSIAIELGDTYSGDDRRNGEVVDAKTPHRMTVGRPQSGRANTGQHWPRPKSLALIPQLYAVALAYGINPLTGKPSPAGRWLVRNVVVWHRPNPAVGALGDKVRPSTSYIVIATRSAKRWFDLTAVRTAPGPVGGQTVANGKPTGSRNDDNVPHITANNPAGAPPLDTWFDQYDDTHDTWTLTTQPSGLAHYAMWPARLAERLILMMCPREVCRICGEPRRRVEGKAEYVTANGHRHDGHEWNSGIADQLGAHSKKPDGNTTRNAPTLGWTDCGCYNGCSECSFGDFVDKDHPCGACDCTGYLSKYRPGLTLDPFAGSGTTLAVADLHGRDAIGIDIDARNAEIYPRRYDEVKKALFGTAIPDPAQGVLL